MKKSSKVWKGFLVAGITALILPPVVYGGQTAAGEGSSGSPSSSGTYSGSSETKSGTSSGMTGSTGTHSGSSGTSGMTGSTGTHTGTHSGSSSMSGMNKDMASTDADKSLNSLIRQSMSTDTSLANVGQNVHFSTQDGEVTLHGSVASETEKNQIEQKVKELSDVKSVKNELQVASVGSSSSMDSAN
jgi:osmotically-inducible protein OsmY